MKKPNLLSTLAVLVCAEDLVLVCADVERASRREDVEEVRRLVNQLKEKVQITLKEIKESYDK